jgi:hypothetical protein
MFLGRILHYQLLLCLLCLSRRVMEDIFLIQGEVPLRINIE